MCGIAGLFTTSSLELQSPLTRMQTALQHRGPDDAGHYLSPKAQAALAHTRLSILDLSPAGHQPMSTPDGRYWITFNGEIYNFRELRSHLEQQGERFHSHTDTEVILKLFQRQGPDCVHQLRGMFAFALWDEWEQRGFLARDPLGIKPLYYWQQGSTLVFASEVRSLLASGLPKRQMCPEGLHSYLTTGSVAEPLTLIANVRCLEAGHRLTWQAGQVKSDCYWQIRFDTQPIEPAAALPLVRTALQDSLHHHFVSDVPVGLFLSGGIDSTALLALSQAVRSDPLHTFSIAFEEPEWNEGDIARKIAHHFGAEHTESVVTAALGRSLLPQFLSHIDQPSIDGFNTFCVSQVARQSGIKVALSGLGGDELFGGYRSFSAVPQLVQVGKAAAPLRAVIAAGLQAGATAPRFRRLADFFQHAPTATAAYRSFRGIFSNAEARAIARRYVPDAPPPSQVSDPIAHFSTIQDEVSFLELTGYMRNQLLRDSDRMSMAWGLELRVPFVDQHLLQAIAPIPAAIRLATNKQLLVKAVPEIPEWVVHRPKRGFFFPYQTWLENEWQEYTKVSCPKGISLQLWYRRWCLMVLQHWWEQVAA